MTSLLPILLFRIYTEHSKLIQFSICNSTDRVTEDRNILNTLHTYIVENIISNIIYKREWWKSKPDKKF